MDLKEYVKLNYEPIVKYQRFLLDNDWTQEGEYDFDDYEEKSTVKTILDRVKTKADKFNLQHGVVLGVVERLKYLLKMFEQEKRKKDYGKFLEICKEVVDIHLTRSERYVNEFDISDYPAIYLQEAELKVNTDIFIASSKLRETLSSLNLTTEEEAKMVEFYKDQHAPLAMHHHIAKMFPEVQKKLDDMGIDFNRKPKPTFHILNKNAPEWEENKNYFDQEPEVLQYYVDELNKIKNGLKIGGIYISGWMYYQMNYFVTSYPDKILNKETGKEELGDVIGVPPLRDNEWWIINDNYELAKERNEMLFIAATRRAAKTTMDTSHLGWAMASGKLRLLVAGGSSTDLGQIKDNFTLLQQNIHPAFKIFNLVDDWGREVKYGVKLKTGKNIVTSILKIVNLDAGSDKKSEALAGFTPEAVIIDEIMKLPFKAQLAALKPAINSQYGARCVVILTGTAGNEDLAKDAFDVLRDPTTNKVLDMPWDILNSRVPEEFRTWKERPFGTFIPAQMSAKEGMVKDKTNLADFLKIDNEILKKVPIMVTNWERAKHKIQADRDLLKKDIVEYTKEVLYFPICPSDMLLSGKVNPFPVQEAILHRDYLLSIGGVGKKVFLAENTQGNVVITQSNNELASYPHKGGFIDCPIVLYEDLPEDMPPDNLYVAGFDDYKQEESGTDSVGSFHIYKVDAGFDKNCGKIVASLATRPDPHGKLHHQIYLLQKAFNAKCFMENADTDYQTFLELRRVADLWLVEAIDFDGEATQKSTGRRKYGWNPSSKKNKEKLFSLLLSYTKRRFTEEDEEGNVITKLGVQKIDDIGLLDEIIAYSADKNVDRITSFMSCLGYEFYLYCQHMFPDISRQLERKRDLERNKRNTERKRAGSPFFSANKPKNLFR